VEDVEDDGEEFRFSEVQARLKRDLTAICECEGQSAVKSFNSVYASFREDSRPATTASAASAASAPLGTDPPRSEDGVDLYGEPPFVYAIKNGVTDAKSARVSLAASGVGELANAADRVAESRFGGN